MQSTTIIFHRSFSQDGNERSTLKVGFDGGGNVYIVTTLDRTTISYTLTPDEWQQLVSDMSMLRYMVQRDVAQDDAQEEVPDTQFEHIDDIAPIE